MTPMVDGEWIKRDGVVPGQDLPALAPAVQQAAETMGVGTLNGDWNKRSIDQLSPESVAEWRAL